MLIARQATEEDVLYLAPRLRKADLREAIATGYTDPVEALMAGLHSEDGCVVGTDKEGTPIVIGGTAPSNEPLLGYGWMMASDDLQTHWVHFLRNTSQWINHYRKHYRVLANMVHAENTLHIRWLRWAGFTFLRRIELNGEGFYEFAKVFPMEG